MTRAARSRRWMIAAAVGLFAAIFVLRLLDDVPADGVGFLYVLPIALVAVEWGWRWGVAAGVFACLLYLLWAAIAGGELSAVGYATRAFVFIATGAVLGRVAERIRAEGDETDRCFAMANDMLAIASVEGRFTRLNPAWERTLGWSQPELMSRQYADFIHPDDLDATFAAAGALLEGSSEVVGFENRYATKDGGWRWLLWSSYSDGRHVYAVVKDVTERKLLDVERAELLSRVEAMARTDKLTGLPNRRAWEDELRREVARAARMQHVLVVVMLDLDHFKLYNDEYGHQAGDRLLTDLGDLWRTQLRDRRLRGALRRRGVRRAAARLPAGAGDGDPRASAQHDPARPDLLRRRRVLGRHRERGDADGARGRRALRGQARRPRPDRHGTLSRRSPD